MNGEHFHHLDVETEETYGGGSVWLGAPAGKIFSAMTSMLDEAQEPAKQGMFIDAASMKEKLRQNMIKIKPEYDVSHFYKTSGFCQLIARSSIFENATLIVIAFNALWIAIDTDNNNASMLLQADPVFQVAEHCFCIYFTFEWTIRFGAFKEKCNGFKDTWFCFDSIMVAMMVLETWVMTLLLLMMGADSSSNASGGMGDASILRLLRLMRLTRMARMAKLLRQMPELLILIKGMMTAMRSVMYTLALLAILIYIFAVAFRQLTTDSPAGEEYFPSVPEAMHTLLLEGTFMDNAGAVVRALREESVAYVVMFYVFTCVGSLMIMNMLIGVLCEVVSAVAATEKEQIAVATVKDGFMEIIEKGGLDTDGDSMISKKEFEEILLDNDAVRLLERVDVDVYGLVDLADFLFTPEEDENEEDEDTKENGKKLSFTDFMEVVLSLRGSNNATVRDIVNMRKFIKDSLSHLEEKVCMQHKVSVGKVKRSTSCRSKKCHSRKDSCSSLTLEDDYQREAAPPSESALPWTKIHHNGLSSKLTPVLIPGLLDPSIYEAPPAPPQMEEPPLPPSEAPPVPPGLVASAASATPPVPVKLICSSKRLTLPDFQAKSRMLQELCIKALRLEGVLASAGNEISRFMEGLLPLPTGDHLEDDFHPAPRASSSHDRHPQPDQDSAQQLMPSEVRDLQDLRSKMARLGQAVRAGLEDLQSAQQRI